MTPFTPVASLAGGVLLGVASTLLYASLGKVAGISGIVGGLPGAPAGDRGWRAAFVGGLLAGGLALVVALPAALPFAGEASVATSIVAGLLVGVGTRLGRGCTSGHGLCGLALRSGRSLVATAVFMGAAGLTTFVVRHGLHAGGAP